MHNLGINKLITIAHAHSVEWQYELSIEKSVGMRRGKDCMPDGPVKLGNYKLSLVMYRLAI